MGEPRPLTDEDRERYAWQLSVPGLGVRGQEILKGSTVLISRCGGVGGQVAHQLVAAGIGRLVLAHGGRVRCDDLNRQLLMTHASIGRPRIEIASQRLLELNPNVQIEAVAENLRDENVAGLVAMSDIVVSAAPLFAERLLLNREAVRQKKPLVDCAVFDLDAQLTTIVPGKSPCLACLYAEEPPGWQRRFPILGAVAGMIGSLAALEVIKLLTGLATPVIGKLLLCDLREMSFRRVQIRRRPGCVVCGGAA